MTISNYPNGFRQGVNIRGVPILNTYGGNVFWLDSGAGSNGNKGNYDRPFATIDYAFSRCTANNGDLIMVKAGHSETFSAADGAGFDVAGVSVIGLGNGADRPKFILDTANTADINVTAANIFIQNLVFEAGFADIVRCLQVTSTDFHADSCEWTDQAANENWVTPIKATGAANTADGLKVTNCKWTSIDAACAEFIEVTDDLDRGVFNGNTVITDAATAGRLILSATGKDLTNVEIVGNHISIGNTSGALLVSNDTSANSGIVAYNLIGHHDTAGEAVGPLAGARWFENYATAADDASGYILPAVDS